MRFRPLVGLVVGTATVLAPLTFIAPSTAAPSVDFAVTDDGPYTRHDGGTDQAIAPLRQRRDQPRGRQRPQRRRRRLATTAATAARATSPRSPSTPPTRTSSSPAGTTTARPTWRRAGWAWASRPTAARPGLDSTLPGYPLDTPPRAAFHRSRDAPTRETRWWPSTTTAGSSSAGISFNRAMPQNGSVFVSTYGANPGPAGPTGQLPKDYLRTLIIDKAGTPSLAGIFQDKPMLEVDRSTASPFEDNVYFCWSKFQGNWSQQDLLQPLDRPRCLLLERRDRLRRQRPGL